MHTKENENICDEVMFLGGKRQSSYCVKSFVIIICARGGEGGGEGGCCFGVSELLNHYWAGLFHIEACLNKR